MASIPFKNKASTAKPAVFDDEKQVENNNSLRAEYLTKMGMIGLNSMPFATDFILAIPNTGKQPRDFWDYEQHMSIYVKRLTGITLTEDDRLQLEVDYHYHNQSIFGNNLNDLRSAQNLVDRLSSFIQESSINTEFKQMMQKGRKLQSDYSLGDRQNDIKNFLSPVIFTDDIQKTTIVNEYQLLGYLIHASHDAQSPEIRIYNWMTNQTQLTWQQSLITATQCLQNAFGFFYFI